MSTVTEFIRFLVRAGTAAAVAALNEIPLARELIFETDTGKAKLGDGATNYNTLLYIGGQPATAGQTLAALSARSAFVAYNGTTQAAGKWDGGTTAPAHTTRLNYDGYLYATRFYGDGSQLTGIDAGTVNINTVPNVLQTLIARGSWAFSLPIPGQPTQTVIGYDSTAVGGTGTVTAIAIAMTSTFTRQARRRWTSSAGAGSDLSAYSTAAKSCLAGGFQYTIRFGVSDAAAVANARLFCGLRASTSAFANANPSSFTDIIAVAADTGDANLQIMHNDSSGTATKIDLGASFPSNTLETDFYEAQFLALPGAGTCLYHVRNVTTGATASGTLSTNLPGSTTGLARAEWRNNGTTALAVRMDMGGWSFQTNREG